MLTLGKTSDVNTAKHAFLSDASVASGTEKSKQSQMIRIQLKQQINEGVFKRKRPSKASARA